MQEPLLDFMWIALAFVRSAPPLGNSRQREQPNEQREQALPKTRRHNGPALMTRRKS